LTQPSLDTSRLNVLIQLGQGDSAQPLPSCELVQLRHFQSLRKQIKNHLDSPLLTAGSSNQREYPYGSGWTQFIDGSRGAGKSTFLSSVMLVLKADSELGGRMAFFSVIDPSRIERSEMPLLLILQALRMQVDSKLKTNCHLEDDSLCEEWRQAFRRVAGGLSIFEKDYHPLNDLDPELFLDWGLERTSDSVRLRVGLHRLFELACRILGVQVLLLGFDDADTDSTFAVPLLECIRKYLDTPRVMVLVTGDLELYSLLVRQHFAKTVAGKPEAALDLQRSSKNGDRSAQYLRMIDHLEEQYLLKLFPIRRRMQLQPLWSVIQRDECQVAHPDWGVNPFSVKEVVDTIVKRGLRIKTKSDVALYTEFLLKQPLRTVLQVIERCAAHLVGALSPTNSSDEDWSRELTREFSRALQALALTGLYKLSVDTDAIAAMELPALIQAVFDLSLQDGDIDTAPYLRPMSANQDIKACFAALAGEVPNFCAQKPGTALRYLMRGPGSVSLYSLAQPHLDTNALSRSQDSVARFTSYMGVGRREDSLDWARRATAVIAQPFTGNSARRVVAPGIVGLRRSTKDRPKQELTASTVVQKAIKLPHGALPVFALGMVHVVSETSPRTYGSIYSILGLVEKLLSQASKDNEMARTAFDRVYPPLTVSAPSWSLKGGAEIEVDEPDDENGESQLKSKRDALWTKVDEWLKSVESLSKQTFPSGIFLGKVWTRIYFSLHNAAQELKTAKFATLMEIFAVCVLNAFLVEEAEHHMPSAFDVSTDAVRVDRNNPRNSAAFFVEKLEKLKPERSIFPFSSIMATCPILLGLLDQRKGYAKILKSLFPDDFRENQIEALLCPSEIFDIVENISVAGGKVETGTESTETENAKGTQQKKNDPRTKPKADTGTDGAGQSNGS